MYWGKILHIDVSKRKTHVQELDDDWLKKYVGGVAMAARLAYDNIPKGADPLGPDNALCFANSAFAGTMVPVGSKYAVCHKSPLTGLLGDCLAGSYFSASMKRAGYDEPQCIAYCEKKALSPSDPDVVAQKTRRKDVSKLLQELTASS